MRISKVVSLLPPKYWIKAICYIYGVPILRKLVDNILKSISILIYLMPFKVTISFLRHLEGLFKILFDFPSEKIIRQNLITAMRDKIKEEQIQSFFIRHKQHFLNTLIEVKVLANINITTNPLEGLVKIEGKENIDKVLKMGKGIILLSAHIGAYPLLPFVLAYNGYRVNVIGLFKDMEIEKVKKKFKTKLEFIRGTLMLLPPNYIKTMVTLLRKGEVIIIMGDIPLSHDEKTNRIVVRKTKIYSYGRLFDKLVYVPSLHVRLSMKVGTPIVPAFLIRQDNDKKYNLVIKDPIMIEKSDKQSNGEVLSYYINISYRIIESFIQKYPEQWVHWKNFHKMLIC